MKAIHNILILLISIPCLFSCDDEVVDGGNAGPGMGGSLARFAIVGDYLYTVEERSLKVFDITNRAKPVYLDKHYLNVDVETIFPRDSNTLFIGTMQGMFIYDLSNAPAIQYVSSYSHIVSCDPVVADDDYAYVTLHSDQNSNTCFRNVNQLDIVDISDLNTPRIISSFPMAKPKGLGIYGDTLLVCDEGVKVFDVSNPKQITLLNTIKGIDASDLIINGNLVIIAKNDGLEQYRYSNKELYFLSKL